MGSILLLDQVNRLPKSSISISWRESMAWLNQAAKLALNDVVFLSDRSQVRLKSPIRNQGSVMVLETSCRSPNK